MHILDKIISNFKNNKSLYIGEKITISEHMIQSAMLAEKAKCNDNLVCSCLLHDYGHFIIEDPVSLVKNNKDGEHESIGYEYLKTFFNKKFKILKTSNFYKTKSWPDHKKPFFLNIVIEGLTTLKPLDLFKFIKQIEVKLGRKKIEKLKYKHVI